MLQLPLSFHISVIHPKKKIIKIQIIFKIENLTSIIVDELKKK